MHVLRVFVSALVSILYDLSTLCYKFSYILHSYFQFSCVIFLRTDKEYQQRRLLDTLVSGVKIHFERYDEQSLMLEGSINKLRAWDPDTSKTTSDRNRHLLRLVNQDESRKDEQPFFSFRYRTFKTLTADIMIIRTCLIGLRIRLHQVTLMTI